MNILYIHTHDTGRFIQPYGYAIQTPALMKFTQEGILFRQAFSCAPTCSPSRAALLTGMNPHSAGMLGLAHRGFTLKEPSQHLANHLQTNGVETVLCGEQHLIRKGQEETLGYSRVISGNFQGTNPANNRNPMVQDIANAKAVATYLAQPKKQPFFLSFGMICTHRPFPENDPDIQPGMITPPPSLPDVPCTRKDMSGFMTLARNVDRCVGIVLEALETSSVVEDTLVLFTTDHGIAFPGMKCTLFDGGIGISLIFRLPGKERRGTVTDALTSHLDIFPTICDLANIPHPLWLEGYSLVPLIEGRTSQVRETIFAEVTHHAAYEPMRAVRTKRYKYIRYFDDFKGIIKPNIDDSPSKRFLLDQGLLDRPHDPAEMLFDLYRDPNEKENLVGKKSYEILQQQLQAALAEWMEGTDDPLLQGPISLPPGGFSDPQDAIHPT